MLGKKGNFIYSLHSSDGVALSQDDKHSVIFEHFLQHLGSYTPRSCKLNLANLGWQTRHLFHLDEEVSEAELESVIAEAPKEKAPRPDGFIGGVLLFLLGHY
jgi:hypothetical protein